MGGTDQPATPASPPPTTPGPSSSEGCAPIAVIAARGTGEPAGTGSLLAPVAERIVDARGGQVESVFLDYPAASDFDASPTAGVTRLVDDLNRRAVDCPDQRTVLLGYSQGALVVGDVLSAPADRMAGSDTGVLSTAASDRVTAVVLYGDPRFVGSEPFNAGTFDAAENGDFPRRAGALDAHASVIRSFCTNDDFACQEAGGTNQGHLDYFTNGMQQEGADFALDRLAR